MRPPAVALQDQYASASTCFGCGPANPKGLRIKSFVRGEEVVATFLPEPHEAAFEGALNGGICGVLLDCNCNWAATHALMKARNAERPPCTVTAEYAVKLLRPTPMGRQLLVRSRVVSVSDDKKTAVVEGSIEAGGTVTATCRGTFVAVEEGHPAFHRW